jgi:hypothetical protein
MRPALPLALWLLPLAAAAAEPPPVLDWPLLIPGSYHAGEAPIRPGIGWLALTPVGGVWRLEPVIVRARAVHDPVLDADDQRTGIEISASHPEAIALLRLPGLRAGKVDTPALKFKDEYRPIAVGDPPLTLVFKDKSYRLVAEPDRILLQHGALSTPLADLQPAGPDRDSATELFWAGDLDGDGRLDLLLRETGANHARVCLFLSRAATEGTALLRPQACHRGVGC